MLPKIYSLAFVVLGVSLGAASLAPARSAPLHATVPAAGYPLGAGDAISIQVINFPELSVPLITVPPDGKITVPLLGNISVSGRTTSQVASTLTSKWAGYVVDPSVTVTLSQQRRQNVQFYGHVAHAQTIEYKPDLHLVTALAQVGGFADDGDPSQVTVTRKNGTAQTVDLTDPQTRGGTAEDITLSPDDVVYVPQRHTQISVLGEVVKPGSYDYKVKMCVLDALKDADNINPETANLPQATLLHNGQETPLDLYSLLHDGKTENNVELAAGDRIFIPTLHNRIYVDGAVNRPGFYLFKPGDRIVDAINGSGGTRAGESDLAKVSLIHMDKLRNTATVQTVDVFKFYRTANMASNVLLAPGDAVYVPIKGGRTDVVGVLGSIIGIGSSTRVLTR